MEDIDTKQEFSHLSDEELLHEHVICGEADLYLLDCCLGDAFLDEA